ncbi:MAG TPA: hypothetical protein VF434_03810, partial [Promineifilum sp.]
MTESKLNLYDLSIEEVIDLMVAWEQPAFRARQVWGWLYQHFAPDFEAMTNLPIALRERLSAGATLDIGQVV